MLNKAVLTRITTVAVFLLIPLFVGITASAFTAESVSTWYTQINKPSFTPPGFVFGPVWTLLYILMGVSSYIVWKKRPGNKVFQALTIYGAQLVLNFLWSISFFGLKNPALALVDIFLLWLLIILMIVKFYKINKGAGLLQIPYLMWVSFASVLNYSIWSLN